MKGVIQISQLTEGEPGFELMPLRKKKVNVRFVVKM